MQLAIGTSAKAGSPAVLMAALLLCWAATDLLADAAKEDVPEPSPVEVRLIAIKSQYTLPKARHGKAFRQRIEEETDDKKLPSAPRVKLIFEIKNVSQEDVMIWPRGSIDYPNLTVEGPGVVEPSNLRTVSGESSGSSVQPTIAPGKTHRLTITSLNPNGGTPWIFWCEPGDYSITATYTVYTGLPPFPFPDETKPVGKPKQYEVTTPPIKVRVVLEGEE
ncbi:MAG: hypothetical protein AB7O62_24730 [Pirellulales bacterium]